MEEKYKPEFYKFYQYFENKKEISYENLISIINGDVKNHKELRAKILSDVNLFYKWQLLKRNPDYRAAVDIAKKEYGDDYVDLSSGEANQDWKISEFFDYTMNKPPESFNFNLEQKFNFYELGEYSFKDFFLDANKVYDISEQDLKESHKIDSRLDKIIESSIAGVTKEKLMLGSRVAPNEEDGDKRFCLLAVDLKTSSSTRDLKDLSKFLQEKIEQYGANETSKQLSPDKWSLTKYIDRFDKGILVYDYVVDNNGNFNGLEKEIKKITGEKQDQSTLRGTFATYRDYVINVVQVYLQLEKAE